MARVWRNWGRTQACRPARIAKPRSEADIRALLEEAAGTGRRVKVVGHGHSFTDIACTDGLMIDLSRYDRVLDVDVAAGTVTVQAGITIRKLNEELAKVGLGMSNLGDIGYQSIAGAISTATHGTGPKYGNLATFVEHLTLVLADGTTLHCSADTDPKTFRAAQVSLGSLGVISTLTLRCEPAFNLYAHEEGGELGDVLGNLDELVDGNEHFEFYWFPHTSRVWTKRNNRTDRDPSQVSRWKEFKNDIVMSNVAFGAFCAVGKGFPRAIPTIMQKVVTPGLGRVRRVARSDLIYTSPRLVRFSEMEYAIPREHATEAITRIRGLIESRGFRVNFPIEVRFVAPDDIFLSPANGRATCYIAVHLYRGMDYEPYFRAVEEVMTSLGGRPHWGKLHFREAEDLAPAYPQWNDFKTIRSRLDPHGRFRNPYLDRVLGLP